jgi:hypothetical protein
MLHFFKKRRENFKEIKELNNVSESLEKLEQEIQKVSQNLENFKKETKGTFQKFGIVRFNPFSEIGGNQSFSLALLDGNNSGTVVTGLYNREGNRVYAKPISKGQSKYPLSEEEKEAINKAINQRTYD